MYASQTGTGVNSVNSDLKHKKASSFRLRLMQLAGLEPAPSYPGHEPESCAYANSATTADTSAARFRSLPWHIQKYI